mgnify:CR=1 FL=1
MGIGHQKITGTDDGGRAPTPDEAIALGFRLAKEGADFIDVGGESTRPGAAPVSVEDELRRIKPVVTHLAGSGIKVSIDTSKARIAERALDCGAKMVNDVTALRGDASMAPLISAAGVPVVLMHMRGEPRTMQNDPRYSEIMAEIGEFFEERIAFAERSGIRRDRIILDPGIGFGKTPAHNLEILRRLREFQRFGLPIMVGASRKSFIGTVLADHVLRTTSRVTPDVVSVVGAGHQAGPPSTPPEDRLEGSLAVAALAVAHGAAYLRVHDVQATARAVALAEAIVRCAPG